LSGVFRYIFFLCYVLLWSFFSYVLLLFGFCFFYVFFCFFVFGIGCYFYSTVFWAFSSSSSTSSFFLFSVLVFGLDCSIYFEFVGWGFYSVFFVFCCVFVVFLIIIIFLGASF
jgi:hypothetical protein